MDPALSTVHEAVAFLPHHQAGRGGLFYSLSGGMPDGFEVVRGARVNYVQLASTWQRTNKGVALGCDIVAVAKK
jgi:hypothetical protein